MELVLCSYLYINIAHKFSILCFFVVNRESAEHSCNTLRNVNLQKVSRLRCITNNKNILNFFNNKDMELCFSIPAYLLSGWLSNSETWHQQILAPVPSLYSVCSISVSSYVTDIRLCAINLPFVATKWC